MNHLFLTMIEPPIVFLIGPGPSLDVFNGKEEQE